MDTHTLVVGLIAGAFGLAYFVYGKRQSKFTPVICGVLLSIYPFFTDNLLAQVTIGAVLLAAPFFIDF